MRQTKGAVTRTIPVEIATALRAERSRDLRPLLTRFPVSCVTNRPNGAEHEDWSESHPSQDGLLSGTTGHRCARRVLWGRRA